MRYQHYLHVVIEFLQYVEANWSTIAAYSVGGISIITVLELLRRKFKLSDKEVRFFRYVKLDGSKIIVALLSLFVLLGTLADYAISAHIQNPKVIPKNFAYLLTAAVLIHRFVGSSTFKAIANWINTSPYFGAVKELKDAKQAAATTAAQPDPTTTFEKS